jgi:predicted acyl esterase
MSESGFQYHFRDADEAPERPAQYQKTIESGMIVERDFMIPLRDGVELCADIFRPVDEKPVPPIIAWTPYGKHVPLRPERYLDCGLRYGDVSPYTAFEAPDPAYWVPHGYAVLYVEIRGTWKSGGDAVFVAPEERHDIYDVIEWAAAQPWSNGKVGMSGVSYLALMQWRVAELNPPSLAAINPWEGWSDTYREVSKHGGIPDSWFWPALMRRWGAGLNKLEDLTKEGEEHPFYDAYWESKSAQLEKITTPAFVVSSWTDQGLHTRGTLKGFEKIASEQKWLDIHADKKWRHYYLPESLDRLKTFFDHFLKGIDNDIKHWPKVRYMVRDRHLVGTIRQDTEWPLANTEYRPLYIDAAAGVMNNTPPASETQFSYNSLEADGGTNQATFDYRFSNTTELVGHMKLKLWVSADAADDMDLFVAIQKFDIFGNEVNFPYFMQFDDGVVALGWLRVSHRELDVEKSTPHQPVLAHQRELKLTPGEIVPVEIEIWPSGTIFHPGDTLRVLIQGSDIRKYDKQWAMYCRHEITVNQGQHVIYSGGEFDSHLLVPVTKEQ